MFKGNEVKIDDWFRITTGVSGYNNNWLLMVEQAVNVTKSDCVICMGPRPILQIVPAVISDECILDVMNNTNPNATCQFCDEVFPNTGPEKKKTIFSKIVAPGNFSCINRTGKGVLGNLSSSWCAMTLTVSVLFTPVSRGDIWWWCGDDRIFDRLPVNTTGYCALVSLLLPVSVYPMSAIQLIDTLSSAMPERWRRHKRSATWLPGNDPTYIDAIGVP